MLFGLFVLSLAGVGASYYLPEMEGLLLLAGPVAVACLILLTQDLWRRPTHVAKRAPVRQRRNQDGEPIVIDGSNVLFWRDNAPDLDVVAQVISALEDRGFAPGVMFDATIGYKIGVRYRDDAEMARLLGLPADRVLVVPKGVVADDYILKSARDLGARIVSNDRYRDWAGDHPEVSEPGHVVRGGFRDGKLWLDETA